MKRRKLSKSARKRILAYTAHSGNLDKIAQVVFHSNLVHNNTGKGATDA